MLRCAARFSSASAQRRTKSIYAAAYSSRAARSSLFVTRTHIYAHGLNATPRVDEKKSRKHPHLLPDRRITPPRYNSSLKPCIQSRGPSMRT